ncbi:MAG: UDP-N-acetylmuramoyl-L-alanyl-D-glutamate--2,6-diaminopimelate ligase [Clostridiales bacterium]|jgi:UDP-N-acetylmuramoyl-L-alanyl-D-glutamate--2,6-diaminopimelate ligase|nr:UDP-N-acetylmuramoyl-L-alanyl-D-glutamate--2,6-diaminopimelate ligase [Clostridiales bacterium]
MKYLSDLLKNIEITECGTESGIEIGGISADSRRVKKGDLFVAIKGGASDGNAYINDAVKNGAVAVVSDDKVCASCGLPYVIVKDIREAYAFLSASFFDNPAADMRFIGVSGTNGKTTIAHMIYHILSANGIRAGLTGTIGNIIGGEVGAADMTTPDPYEFFGILRKMKDCGTEAAVSEVSAHAVYLKKINPILADVAVFTNCSQDHLDFFETMEKYESVKKSYFTKKHARTVVLNADDRVGVEIINASDAKVVSYGIKNPSDVFAVNIRLSVNGSVFFANIFDDIAEVRIPLPGLFNVYNSLAAMTAARLLNISLRDAGDALASLPEIPGRFNFIPSDRGSFILDYAHSPDGLKKILTAAKSLSKGKVISVFGCGGNRDRAKRPLMGRISADCSDFTVITSDNPRFEEPQKIMSDIEKGLQGITEQYMNIIDREEAIKRAYEMSGKNDIVVVAGKGAEPYIDIKGIKYEYSDRKAIERVINGKRTETV